MVHAAFIGYGIRYPEHPSTKIYTQNVDQFDLFPISFKFCVKELTNPHYRYQKLGYNSIWSFYKGVIDTSGTLPFVGWAGYNENKSTTQTVQGIADNNNFFFCDLLYKDLLSAVAFNWSGIVDHIVKLRAKRKRKDKTRRPEIGSVMAWPTHPPPTTHHHTTFVEL